MELRYLHAFLAIAEGMSFTRAAESLNYAQSSLTAQIKALEAELGVPVFERYGKRIKLTEAGRRLQIYARKVIQLETELLAVVPGSNEPSGTLQLGAPETLLAYRLPPVLARYRSRHPQVHLVFRPGEPNDLRRGILEGSMDAVFFTNDWTFPDEVEVQDLAVDAVVILAHPEHPLAAKGRVQPIDLSGETLLHTERDSPYRQLFDRTLVDSGVRPEVAIEFSSVEAIKQCTMARMGIAILPESAVAAEICEGKLAALKWFDRDLSITMKMAIHRGRWLSPALTAFVEVVRDVFRPEASND